jgi:hypothetical protein
MRQEGAKAHLVGHFFRYAKSYSILNESRWIFGERIFGEKTLAKHQLARCYVSGVFHDPSRRLIEDTITGRSL